MEKTYMHEFPHLYAVTANGKTDSTVRISSSGLPSIDTAPPVEFGGPGDQWSPETLLVAAVADCFILSFRSITRAARFSWLNLECAVTGSLEKAEGQLRFTRFVVHARLKLDSAADQEKAEKLLHKAEQACLITNSLLGESELEVEITTQG